MYHIEALYNGNYPPEDVLDNRKAQGAPYKEG